MSLFSILPWNPKDNPKQSNLSKGKTFSMKSGYLIKIKTLAYKTYIYGLFCWMMMKDFMILVGAGSLFMWSNPDSGGINRYTSFKIPLFADMVDKQKAFSWKPQAKLGYIFPWKLSFKAVVID